MEGARGSALPQGDGAKSERAAIKHLVVALTAFLTLIDLFAIQAILPSLAIAYRVSSVEIGAAANACTLGMAISSLVTALIAGRLPRRAGVALSLSLLAVPTLLLGFVEHLWLFTAMRVLQGILMAAAFTLMLAYIGEQFMGAGAAPAFAAFVTGNVLSNFVGRLLSASAAQALGLASTFQIFAALNLLGALLVWLTLQGTAPMTSGPRQDRAFAVIMGHLANPTLRAAFAIGFLILFVFIGAFTYVNFVLTREPIALGMMQVGAVYAVFVPSLVTTLLAGRLAGRIGSRRALVMFLLIACVGFLPLGISQLVPVLAGLVLVAIGTFGAQALATGIVGMAAESERGAASGIYLASYFAGGLAGSILLGLVYERFGWPWTLLVMALATLLAILIALRIPSARLQPR
jgi:predicted MFS family arabinose efflux permease